MLDVLTQLTKEEADNIEHIVRWTNEERAAFLFAKKIFDEENEGDG